MSTSEICVHCGCTIANPNEICCHDQYVYCSDCFEDMVECSHCGRLIDIDDRYYIWEKDIDLCPRCFIRYRYGI